MGMFSKYTDDMKLAYLERNKYRQLDGMLTVKELNQFFTPSLLKKIWQVRDDFDRFPNPISDLGNYFDFKSLFDGKKSLSEEHCLLFCIMVYHNINVKNIFNSKTHSKKDLLNLLNELHFNERVPLIKVLAVIDADLFREFFLLNSDKFLETDLVQCISLFRSNKKEDHDKAKVLLENEVVKNYLVTKIAAPYFYEIIDKIGGNKELYNSREQYLQYIISKPEEYSSDSIKQAICDLYFKNNYHNIKLQVRAIKDYADKDVRFKKLLGNNYSVLRTILKLLEASSTILDENYYEYLKYLEKLNKNESLFTLIDKCEALGYDFFKSNLSRKVFETEQKITKVISPSEYLSTDGKRVLLYDIDNQNLNQRDLLFFAHSFSLDTSAHEFCQKFGQYKNVKRSFSIMSENKNTVFNREPNIILGYSNIDAFNVLSVNVMDAQTNQFKVNSGVKRKIMKDNLLPLDEFMLKTQTYNEVSMEIDGQLKPDFMLIKHSTPTQTEIDIAAYFNIPIRYLNVKSYPSPQVGVQPERELYSYPETFEYKKRAYVFTEERAKAI